MMINLNGKVALITGASRGQGRAIALKLAEAGADIVLNFANTRSAADELARQIADRGRRVAEVQADVSEPDDVAAMLEWVEETFGRLDILVSNVSLRSPVSLLDATPDAFAHTMNMNVRPLLLLAQAASPLMARSGSAKLIALSSSGSDLADPRFGLVGASHAAVESAVRHLAAELADRGITVNAVQTTTDATVRNEAGVADTVLFLASSLSDAISGQTLVINTSAARVPA